MICGSFAVSQPFQDIMNVIDLHFPHKNIPHRSAADTPWSPESLRTFCNHMKVATLVPSAPRKAVNIFCISIYSHTNTHYCLHGQSSLCPCPKTILFWDFPWQISASTFYAERSGCMVGSSLEGWLGRMGLERQNEAGCLSNRGWSGHIPYLEQPHPQKLQSYHMGHKVTTLCPGTSPGLSWFSLLSYRYIPQYQQLKLRLH